MDLLMGVTATDVLEVFSDAEIQHGFEADHRDRLLRTFVTNNYKYHLQVRTHSYSCYLHFPFLGIKAKLRLRSKGEISRL